MRRDVPLLGDARRVLRAGLVLLALFQAPVGIWAVLAPHSFWKSFPGGGHSWVSAAGPYDEHLVRDVGALELALMVLFLLAALWMTERLVQAALIAQLFWALPHLAYHLTALDDLGTGDNVASTTSLALELLIPIALLWVLKLALERPISPITGAPGRVPMSSPERDSTEGAA